MDTWKPFEFDEGVINKFIAASSQSGISADEFTKALALISQSLLGPETGAETVISNSKTDLEIFEPNGENIEKVNFHLIEKIHII